MTYVLLLPLLTIAFLAATPTASAASAARFQMPEEWIDDEFEGTLAPNPEYALSLRSPESFEAFLESDLNPAFAAWRRQHVQ